MEITVSGAKSIDLPFLAKAVVSLQQCDGGIVDDANIETRLEAIIDSFIVVKDNGKPVMSMTVEITGSSAVVDYLYSDCKSNMILDCFRAVKGYIIPLLKAHGVDDVYTHIENGHPKKRKLEHMWELVLGFKPDATRYHVSIDDFGGGL